MKKKLMRLNIKWLFFLYVLIFLFLVLSGGILLIPQLSKKYVYHITQEKLNSIGLESIGITERLRERILESDLSSRQTLLKRFPWAMKKLQNLTENNMVMYAMILSLNGRIVLHSTPYFEGYHYNDAGQQGIFIPDKPIIREIPIFYGQMNDKLMEIAIPIYSGERVIGTMRVGISGKELYARAKTIQEEFRNFILLRMLLLIALVAISGYVLWYLFIRHINFEKRTAEMRKLSTIGSIAGGLAHELRNPLNSMKFNIRLIVERAAKSVEGKMTVDNDFLEMLDDLDSEIDRLSGTLSDFLEYAKPSNINPEKFNINEAIDGILDFIEPECTVKNIRFSRKYNDVFFLLLPLNGFKQCILNLVLNAREASPQEGGEIKITTYRKKLHICIDIADEGCGIPKEISDKVFDVFFSNKDIGTGLGLTIVKQFVEQAGGTIAFKSEIGRGTVFTISFLA